MAFSLAKGSMLKSFDLANRYKEKEEKKLRYKPKCHIWYWTFVWLMKEDYETSDIASGHYALMP